MASLNDDRPKSRMPSSDALLAGLAFIASHAAFLGFLPLCWYLSGVFMSFENSPLVLVGIALAMFTSVAMGVLGLLITFCVIALIFAILALVAEVYWRQTWGVKLTIGLVTLGALYAVFGDALIDTIGSVASAVITAVVVVLFLLMLI